MTEPKPKVRVYQATEASARIGPLGAWKVGDKVKIPKRTLGFPHRETRAGFVGIVRSVDPDGVANVRPDDGS